MSTFHHTDNQIQAELKIIDQAKKDNNAFAPLYEKYYSPIYLYICKRVDSKSATEDIVSQCFLKAIVNIKKYQYKGVPFSAWLYRIATNEINLYYRKTKKQRSVNIEDAGIERLCEELVDDNECDKNALAIQCINLLEEKELEIVELRFFEFKSYKEIAYILRITESNAKVKVHRIIEKLRKKTSTFIIND